MKKEDVLELIAQGEGETIEFKESYDREATETTGAFANTKGGKILIGVSDKGHIKGIMTGKDTTNNWVNQISQATDPCVIPDVQILEIGKKKIGIIEIKEFPIKPISVKGRVYKRVGNSNRVLTPSEIMKMHFESTGLSWDMMPVQRYEIDDIDFEKVKDFAEAANKTGRRKITEKDPVDILKKLELVKENKPTWAAILLFGKNPNGVLTQASIHCGRFKEKEKRGIVDDRMIGGSIIEQIDEAMDFVSKNINVKFIITGRPQREEVWDYPLHAVREAIINAVCHRDYTHPSNTDIMIYEDSLIISNPGGLWGGLTLKDLYKPHASASRNKGIAGVFYNIGLIEQWGSGIENMRNACKMAGIPEPVFKTDRSFQIEFMKDVFSEEFLRRKGLNERQIKAFLYIKETGKITNKDYRQLNNISDEGARKDLNELVEKGILEVKGFGRGTYYTLIKVFGD